MVLALWTLPAFLGSHHPTCMLGKKMEGGGGLGQEQHAETLRMMQSVG
jgi:hypothetical protein